MRIKLMGSTQEPADVQMDIKAPRESELPSDLFMTNDDCGGGNETKRKQLSLKETDLSLFDQGSQSSSCSSQVFVVSRSLSLSLLGWGGGSRGEERVSTTVPLLPSNVSPIFLQFQHDYFLFSLCTHPKKQPAEEERKKERK